jgi:hypothetical protein
VSLVYPTFDEAIRSERPVVLPETPDLNRRRAHLALGRPRLVVRSDSPCRCSDRAVGLWPRAERLRHGRPVVGGDRTDSVRDRVLGRHRHIVGPRRARRDHSRGQGEFRQCRFTTGHRVSSPNTSTRTGTDHHRNPEARRLRGRSQNRWPTNHFGLGERGALVDHHSTDIAQTGRSRAPWRYLVQPLGLKAPRLVRR